MIRIRADAEISSPLNLIYKVKSLFQLVLFLAVAIFAEAKLVPNSLFSNGMVLQQQSDVCIWGEADPDALIKVLMSWSDIPVSTLADKKGKWSLTIPTPKASFHPQHISIKANDEAPITIQDVLIGEVWLASGQSNMEMPLKGFDGCCVEDGLEEAINASQINGIRFYTVPKRQEWAPLDDVNSRWASTKDLKDTQEFSATAWYFAKALRNALQVPIGIVCSAYGGSRVESWLPEKILKKYPEEKLDKNSVEKMTSYHRPMLMYNGMLAPIVPYTIKGIIWYQGCSNVGKHDVYAQRLSTMVNHWRELWDNKKLPFYYCEIAPYDYGSGDYAAGARLREAQFQAQELIPFSHMVSLNDVTPSYELHNIHPKDKKKGGNRLAYTALNLTYGKDYVAYRSPRYERWERKGCEAWVKMQDLDRGICRNYDIRGFELAGADKKFHPADSVRLNWRTNEIVVSSKEVAEPIAVRYGFRDFLPGTLYGANEMPAIPFRTDDWE